MNKVYWTLAVAVCFLVSTIASSDPDVGSVDPTVTPADLNAPPAELSAPPADLSAAPADPSAAPADSSAAPADSSAAPADSSAAPTDPSAAPADSSATHTDPDQDISAIVRSMQHLLGEVIGHQQTTETLVKGIYARLEDIASRQQGMERQQEDIASRLQGMERQQEDIVLRQQGVESHLEDIISRQQGVESQLEDIASRQQSVESHLEDIISRLEGVATWQNYTTEKLASVAAETRLLATPRDCSDLPPGSPSGVYQVRLTAAVGPTVDAFCNQTIAEGGWTVFQRRANIQPRQNFYLTWQDYKSGFGNMDGGEFWWGLKHLTRMTSSDRKYQLRIDLEDEDGNWGYAEYDNFRISSEADGYRLHASNYTGDVGDSFTTYSVGQKFTTKDRDQDGHPSVNCAQRHKGAWWYISGCGYSNLNGRYKPGTSADYTVVWWYRWSNYKCLKTVEIKLRPA